VKIDRLPPESQEQLRKMSTDRLMATLTKAGYDGDRISDMGRAELLEAMAEVKSHQDLSQEAAQTALPTDESFSVGSEAGTEAVRLRTLELEAEERRAAKEERKGRLSGKPRNGGRKDRMKKGEQKGRPRNARAEREDRREQEKARMQYEQAKLAHEMEMAELRAREDPISDDDVDDGHTPRENRGEENLARRTNDKARLTENT